MAQNPSIKYLEDERERLQNAVRLALQRLVELNRDDEAGIRMVLANALDPDRGMRAALAE